MAASRGSFREDPGTAQQRRQMVASRREILLGTNQYPDTNDAGKSFDPDIAFPTSGKAIHRWQNRSFGRAAEDFEKLRLAVENHTGGKPTVFMLTFGNLAMRFARAQFSCNFFACAGYEVFDNLGFTTVEEGVKAALKAKPIWLLSAAVMMNMPHWYLK